ncbi:MAG: class I SAM-dependent methyltransferase [Bacteroidales bacterium]
MKRQALYPSFFARFYDTIYHQMRDSADHDYYLNKIKSVTGPVLEIGVGTGRFFADARKQGVDIYGIDISPAMVEVLKNKLPFDDHQRISVQDIRNFTTHLKYNLVIAPFRVFMHLLNVDDQLKALTQVYNSLNEGGTFIFDLFIPDLKMLINGLDNVKDFEGNYQPGKLVRRFVSMKADLVNQLSNIDFTLEWEEDGELHCDDWHTSLRFFFRHELELLLRLSPFKSFNIFGDFEENELNSSSKEFIVHAIK